MNNTDHPLSEQTSKPPDHPYDTAGLMLRKARENANLTQAAVGEALHLTVHYIKALENDDYSKLPGATFVKGYFRVYARFLKLDVNAVLASYEKHNVSAEELSNRTELRSRNQKRHDQTFRWAVVTAIIIVVGVAAGWWFVGKDQVVPGVAGARQDAPQQAISRSAVTTSAAASPRTPGSSRPASALTAGIASAETAAVIDTTETNIISEPSTSDSRAAEEAATISGPALIPDATSIATGEQTGAPATDPTLAVIPEQQNVAMTITPTVDGARQVTLVGTGTDMLQLYFKGASWVEIDDGATGRLYNETLNSGDAVTLHGTAPFTVLLGDAAQVELSFNSVPINLASQIRSDKTARFSLGAAAAPPTNIAASQGANP